MGIGSSKNRPPVVVNPVVDVNHSMQSSKFATVDNMTVAAAAQQQQPQSQQSQPQQSQMQQPQMQQLQFQQSHFTMEQMGPLLALMASHLQQQAAHANIGSDHRGQQTAHDGARQPVYPNELLSSFSGSGNFTNSFNNVGNNFSLQPLSSSFDFGGPELRKGTTNPMEVGNGQTNKDASVIVNDNDDTLQYILDPRRCRDG
jgi:hypothetical protein